MKMVTIIYLLLHSPDITDLETLRLNDRFWFFLRTKEFRSRGEIRRQKKRGRQKGRRRRGEKRDGNCAKRSTETQTKCEGEDEKQEERWESVSMAFFFLGGRETGLVVLWPPVWQVYDQKIRKNKTFTGSSYRTHLSQFGQLASVCEPTALHRLLRLGFWTNVHFCCTTSLKSLE